MSDESLDLFDAIEDVVIDHQNQHVVEAALCLLCKVMLGEVRACGGDQSKLIEIADIFAADLRRNLLDNAGKNGIPPARLSS